MKTQGEIERAVSGGMGRFEQEYIDLGQIRFGSWMNRVLARSQRQAISHHVDKDEDKHQHHRGPNSPIPMRVLPKVVARVNVIPCLGSFALDSVLVAFHGIPNK